MLFIGFCPKILQSILHWILSETISPMNSLNYQIFKWLATRRNPPSSEKPVFRYLRLPLSRFSSFLSFTHSPHKQKDPSRHPHQNPLIPSPINRSIQRRLSLKPLMPIYMCPPFVRIQPQKRGKEMEDQKRRADIDAKRTNPPPFTPSNQTRLR